MARVFGGSGSATRDEPATKEPKKHRLLTIEQAADDLNENPNQIRALFRTGELRGIHVGGRCVTQE
ncbi:hypothetical protein [uncultured Arthrobacter sp.]|uniref:hypothetical protein n=1 Tax=uncultured Arthrobacter sp. TaxID=114050 RepID=UPI0028D34E6A|nr:hypothetical protein [uncultured Arthrobacter sp.]